MKTEETTVVDKISPSSSFPISCSILHKLFRELMSVSAWDSEDREMRKSKTESQPQRGGRKSSPQWSGTNPSTSRGAECHGKGLRRVSLEKLHWKGDSQKKCCLMFVVITEAAIMCFQLTCLKAQMKPGLELTACPGFWKPCAIMTGCSEESACRLGKQCSEKEGQTFLPLRACSHKRVQIPGTRVLLVLMLPTSCGKSFYLSQLAFLF